MIIKEYGRYMPYCDGCGDYLSPCDIWGDALEAMRDEGWHSVPTANGEWENYCPNCGKTGSWARNTENTGSARRAEGS